MSERMPPHPFRGPCRKARASAHFRVLQSAEQANRGHHRQNGHCQPYWGSESDPIGKPANQGAEDVVGEVAAHRSVPQELYHCVVVDTVFERQGEKVLFGVLERAN
jgi:hypothetical protein